MATERGSLFESGELQVDDFDVKKPPTRTSSPNSETKVQQRRPSPAPSDIRKLGAETGFTQRAVRRGRKRTGRTEQLNVKVTAGVLREFYRIADEQDWVLGEVLEHAIVALGRELESKS